MTTPTPRHLRLVRPSSPGPTPDPDDPDVAELIDEATAWKRVEVGPRAAALLRIPHLVVVPDARAAGVPAPTITP